MIRTPLADNNTDNSDHHRSGKGEHTSQVFSELLSEKRQCLVKCMFQSLISSFQHCVCHRDDCTRGSNTQIVAPIAFPGVDYWERNGQQR